jgi:hypothetical protein
MAITRTAMIDDDGSGTTGTIINNAWKTELYNQIDGAVTLGGVWADVPFNAANFTAVGGGTWTVGAAAITDHRYTLIGKTLHWRLYLSWFAGSNTIAGAVTALRVTVPGGLTLKTTQIEAVAYALDGGGARIAVDAAPVGAQLELKKVNGAAWTPGAPGLVWVLTFEAF